MVRYSLSWTSGIAKQPSRRSIVVTKSRDERYSRTSATAATDAGISGICNHAPSRSGTAIGVASSNSVRTPQLTLARWAHLYLISSDGEVDLTRAMSGHPTFPWEFERVLVERGATTLEFQTRFGNLAQFLMQTVNRTWVGTSGRRCFLRGGARPSADVGIVSAFGVSGDCPRGDSRRPLEFFALFQGSLDKRSLLLVPGSIGATTVKF